MAEKFDKYYEYFSKSSGRTAMKARSINLGIIKINLGGGSSIELSIRGRGRASLTSGIMEGENISAEGLPSGVRVVKGKHVSIRNSSLDVVEGDEVTLTNVNVKKVVGRRVTIVNSDVESVEAEEAKFVNTDAVKVTVTRGEFVNSNIDT
ncbi:MAG: hypothetical protein ACP5L5_09230, partial [Vulcanisaeta sp.]|uniref:hypothetical protein n=1 Tax=Vulcanisaeta sp. TaxID=2020871 RepID=UPI003D10F334